MLDHMGRLGFSASHTTTSVLANACNAACAACAVYTLMAAKRRMPSARPAIGGARPPLQKTRTLPLLPQALPIVLPLSSDDDDEGEDGDRSYDGHGEGGVRRGGDRPVPLHPHRQLLSSRDDDDDDDPFAVRASVLCGWGWGRVGGRESGRVLGSRLFYRPGGFIFLFLLYSIYSTRHTTLLSFSPCHIVSLPFSYSCAPLCSHPNPPLFFSLACSPPLMMRRAPRSGRPPTTPPARSFSMPVSPLSLASGLPTPSPSPPTCPGVVSPPTTAWGSRQPSAAPPPSRLQRRSSFASPRDLAGLLDARLGLDLVRRPSLSLGRHARALPSSRPPTQQGSSSLPSAGPRTRLFTSPPPTPPTLSAHAAAPTLMHPFLQPTTSPLPPSQMPPAAPPPASTSHSFASTLSPASTDRIGLPRMLPQLLLRAPSRGGAGAAGRLGGTHVGGVGHGMSANGVGIHFEAGLGADWRSHGCADGSGFGCGGAEAGVPSRRHPFSAQMVSEKSPDAIFQDLQRVLRQEHVVFTPAAQPLCVRCVWDDLLFEAEVVKVPRLNMHGVHFRRVRGDAVVYQKMCSVLVQAIQI